MDTQRSPVCLPEQASPLHDLIGCSQGLVIVCHWQTDVLRLGKRNASLLLWSYSSVDDSQRSECGINQFSIVRVEAPLKFSSRICCQLGTVFS